MVYFGDIFRKISSPALLYFAKLTGPGLMSTLEGREEKQSLI